jgi:uncharacterized protein YfbU (UPF0304 family)
MFTPVERLLLLNQFRILNALSESKEYVDQVTILEEGFEGEYHRVLPAFGPASEECCKFVNDVLQMYRLLEDYKAHHPEDTEVADHSFATYRGFDDATNAGYARWLLSQRRFEEVLTPWGDQNPHWDMERHYEPMVRVFNTCKPHKLPEQSAPLGLVREQVLSILTASVLP